MSNIIHLIFTPKGPKACFKGSTVDEVYRKFEHKDSKHHISSGFIDERRQQINVYLQRN